MFADIAGLQAFQDLSREVHRQMEKNIQARLDAGNCRLTEFELKFDAFKEEHSTGHPLCGGLKFGGTRYDLTKMSKKELDRARL